MSAGRPGGEVEIRAYRPEDRPRIREICHRTGYMGEPAWFWRDAESFAEVWTAWYAAGVAGDEAGLRLHIDLLPALRGRGAGRAPMETWLERLRAKGVSGCHLVTLHENVAGIAFFEACGFARQGDPVRVAGMRTRDGARMHQQVMVRAL